jgi:hypothetical protein
VDEAVVAELESAIADVGALVTRAAKYRRGAGPEGDALRREALALGDAARRLHRRGTLDVAAATSLLAEARALGARSAALVGAVRAAPEYRAAVEAYRACDGEALARVLPAIFADLEPVRAAGDVYAPLAWLRRGRLRPAADVVADALGGPAAEGDDLSPGADADLPAIVVALVPPPDEPVVLGVPATAVRAPVHRLAATGELLVHAARLPTAGATVRLAARLMLDEQLRVEVGVDDWTRWRDALAAALAAASVGVAIV